MAYRNLSIRVPPELDQYSGTEQIPSYHPSPRGYDTITRSALVDLQKRNKDLAKKLKEHEDAPLLMKNMVETLKQAEIRVTELQGMLKIHAADNQKEARVEALRESAKRVRSLQERISKANSKNRLMENQLKSKRKLAKNFKKAVTDMDGLLEKLAYAKYRGKILEESLTRAREKERELRIAKSQVRGMQNDLDGANNQLKKLGAALVNAHEKWEKRPRDVTRVRVDGESVGHMQAEKKDVHGRPTRDAVKVVELKDKGPGNTYAPTESYSNRSNKEVDLIRTVSELELTNKSIDRMSENIKNENAKLAEQVQTLMKIMQKQGITLTPEQMVMRKPAERPQAVMRNQQGVARPQVVMRTQQGAARPQAVMRTQQGAARPQAVMRTQQGAARPQAVMRTQQAAARPQAVMRTQPAATRNQAAMSIQRTAANPQAERGTLSRVGLPAGVQPMRVMASRPAATQQGAGQQSKIVRF